MNKVKRFFSWLCILVCVFSCVGCKKESESKPILRVITSSQVGATIFTNKHYYLVYDNGKTKKISEFPKSEVICYAFNPDAESNGESYLHLIDNNTDEGRLFNDYAKSVVYLTDKNDNGNVFSPGKLTVINNHFYFTALIESGIQSVNNGLFEYFIDDNSFKKIATFNNSITHVEAYQ